MANTNTVFGARLVQTLGAPIVATPMIVDGDTDATALFPGDLVKLTGADKVWKDQRYYPVVTQAAATDPVVGFVVGFDVDFNYAQQLYRTASTTRLVYVIDNTEAQFEMQMNGIPASGDSGICVDIVVAAGSTVTGLSGMQLNRASAGDNKQIRVLSLSSAHHSEFGAYAKFLCKINAVAHQRLIGTAI